MATHGGRRAGAGRVLGTKLPRTLEKNRVEAVIRQRILKNATNITNKMLELANGCSYLYKMVSRNGSKKLSPVLVTDPKEIAAYLDGDMDSDYYLMTTEKPDLRALEAMFDRVFGKATTKAEIKVEGSIGVFGQSHNEIEKLNSTKKPNKIIEVKKHEIKITPEQEHIKKSESIVNYTL